MSCVLLLFYPSPPSCFSSSVSCFSSSSAPPLSSLSSPASWSVFDPSGWRRESGSSAGPAAEPGARVGALSAAGAEVAGVEEEAAAGWGELLSVVSLSSPTTPFSSSFTLFLRLLGLPGEPSAVPGGTAGSATMPP